MPEAVEGEPPIITLATRNDIVKAGVTTAAELMATVSAMSNALTDGVSIGTGPSFSPVETFADHVRLPFSNPPDQVQEGIRRDAIRHEGRWHDVYDMAMLESDPRPSEPPPRGS